jgi:hypothetical protein
MKTQTLSVLCMLAVIAGNVASAAFLKEGLHKNNLVQVGDTIVGDGFI